MPEYRTYAGLDDRIAKDGDVGFIGFNNRMRPDQLPAGLLADSQNLRTDRRGEAQVRKGIDLVSNPLTVGTNAITLPFFILDATKTTNSTSVSGGGELLLNFASAHTLEAGKTAQVKLSGLSGVAPTTADGRYTATVVDTDTIKLTDKTYTNAASGNVTVEIPTLDDTAVNAIYGSCSFSDPNESASQYIIFAANTKAVAVNIATGVTTDLAYPTGLAVSATASMLQAFNKVFIFRDGATALENNLKISTISAASVDDSDDLVTITTSTNHNLVTGKIVTIHGLGFDAAHPDPNGSTKTITRTSDTQFTYPLTTTDGDETYTVSSSSIVTTDFTKVASGTYTQPAVIATQDSEFSITNNVATVDLGTDTHGLSSGDIITLLESNNSGLTVGNTFVVSTVVDANEFKFFVNSPNVAAHANTVPEFSKRVSVGLGFSHMPAPPYAVYHQRRLVMPFKFSVTGTDTFTSRGILDEVIASDILDTDTYDQIYAQYRFNAGEADFNVGLHSFSEDNLMVFNRNSIHLISNTTSLQGASTRLLTNEVGCVARQSIIQVGNQVIFLSDNGVYSTQFFDEYNLRGTDTPLSEPINVTIQRINKAHWDKSVAVYFDNRYFLAVPLDTSTKNNAIIIYNFLNKQWESIDQVADTDFHISNLLVVGEGNARGVYAVNDLGGVQKLDERVDGVDRVITQVGGQQKNINASGSLTTRQYTFGSLERKNWKQFEMHIESGASTVSNFDISAETENPDFDLPLGTLSDFVGSTLEEAGDVSIRGRIGNRRGYGIQFTINNTTGRPKIRAIEADGSISFRSTNKAE